MRNGEYPLPPGYVEALRDTAEVGELHDHDAFAKALAEELAGWDRAAADAFWRIERELDEDDS